MLPKLRCFWTHRSTKTVYIVICWYLFMPKADSIINVAATVGSIQYADYYPFFIVGYSV